MPPVGGSTLFQKSKASVHTQIGYKLWEAINYVVYLEKDMRHRSNQVWVEILKRLRQGIYSNTLLINLGFLTNNDLDYINKTCYHPNPTLENENADGLYCPYITASNKTRGMINQSSVFQYARLHFQPVYRIIAEEQTKKVHASLFSLRDDQTKRVPILLNLTIGMPISCTQKNTKLNVTNGTIGFVAGFEWHDNTTFERNKSDIGVNILTPSKLPKYIINTFNR
jgi:hypothetical protein